MSRISEKCFIYDSPFQPSAGKTQGASSPSSVSSTLEFSGGIKEC